MTKISRITTPNGSSYDITLPGLNTSVTELNYIQGVTSNIQDQLDDLSAIVPKVSSSDNGKILMVSGGAWSAVTLPNADETSY